MDLTKAVDALCTLNIDNLSTEDAFVKWKNFQNQVLFQQDEYFYKVYEAPEFGLGPFNSMVRRALASAYEQLGIHWEVCSAESHGKTFDFEQRQQLRVATIDDAPFSEIMLSFSALLHEVEKMLGFNDVVEQLKTCEQFACVSEMKLQRFCVNKYKDYAIYEHQAILLDDADFYLALVADDGKRVEIPDRVEVSVEFMGEEFLFTNCLERSNDGGVQDVRLPIFYPVTFGWYLIRRESGTGETEEERSLDVAACEQVGFLHENAVSSLAHNIFVVESHQEEVLRAKKC